MISVLKKNRNSAASFAAWEHGPDFHVRPSGFWLFGIGFVSYVDIRISGLQIGSDETRQIMPDTYGGSVVLELKKRIAEDRL
jgi:hypothetical protein